MGNRPSFAWQSIFNARALLSHGLLRRVGDGQSIKVWGGRWLPTPTTFAVQTPPRKLEETALVAELIDIERKEWNAELLNAVFSEDEAKVISKIPLSLMLPSDRLIWRGTLHSEFTVRSTYHLGKEMQDQEGGQCSHVEKGLDVWKAVWKFQTL